MTMSELKLVPIGGEWNGDMLRIALGLRRMDADDLAANINREESAVERWINGERPNQEDLGYIVRLMKFPEKFFFQAGEYPVRDPRYPLDMYVPLNRHRPVTREAVAALLPLIPDAKLAELYEYMHGIAEYPANVKRFPTP